MTKVMIEVKDPYNLLNEKNAREELFLGTFVDVSIHGGLLKDVFMIPRTAIHDKDMVWIMDKDNLLRIKNIQVVRYEREHALVKDSLKNGDRIVLTNLTGAADGMKLRIAQEENNR
jgi:hypothetical protein